MDLRIILYDLMGELFDFIDKNEIIKYGLIFKSYINLNISSNYLEPSESFCFGPISMLYSRIYLSFKDSINIEKFYDKISKLDKLNQKYFCFNTLYILALNLNPSIINTNTSMNGYICTSNNIDSFIKIFNKIIR